MPRPCSLAVAPLLLAGCSTLSSLPGSVSTRIDSEAEPGAVALHCLTSTTGTGHFGVGEAFETAHEVRQGQVLKIPAPAQTVPICAFHSASFRLLCDRQTTTGPGATSSSRTYRVG